MKASVLSSAAAALLTLTACGDGGDPKATSAETPVADAELDMPADMNMGKDAMTGMAPGTAAAAHTATGSVTAVSGNKVTIAHGPVPSLGWPEMTMAFEAQDPALAQQVKAGDQVTFTFRQEGNRYVLTSLQPQ